MKQQYTAVIKQDSGWWIEWVKEIPGVNSQGKTRRELTANLRSALKEALEFNREDARLPAKGDYQDSRQPVGERKLCSVRKSAGASVAGCVSRARERQW